MDATARRPFALMYPNHYVYLSFPIDKEATAIKWELRGRTHETSDLLVARHIAELLGERGPIDYVQGELGESKGREPILTHLARYRFFESSARQLVGRGRPAGDVSPRTRGLAVCRVDLVGGT